MQIKTISNVHFELEQTTSGEKAITQYEDSSFNKGEIKARGKLQPENGIYRYMGCINACE